MKRVFHCMLQVCSACQQDCHGCVTEIARHRFPDYHMSLEAIENFLRVVQDSDYFFSRLWINGFGEPLLWKHLEEGIKILSKSKHIGSLLIRSNGLNTGAVSQDVLSSITELSLSKYKTNREEIDELVAKHGSRIKVLAPAKFIKLKGWSADIPCSCICSGPCIIEDTALVYCGSVIFSRDTTIRLQKAGKITEEDVQNLTYNNWVEYVKKFLPDNGVVKVQKGFLDSILHMQSDNDFATKNLDACRYCFGNRNFTGSGDFYSYDI